MTEKKKPFTTCKKCGNKIYLRLKPTFKWKMFWQGMAIAIVLEFISNLIVYLIFQYH